VKLMSSGADMTLFSNFPGAATDSVYLNINARDLHFLITHANCKDLMVFYEQVSSTFDGQRCRVVYINALIAVQTMLKACCRLYEQAEVIGN
jgi:hypothetical protein